MKYIVSDDHCQQEDLDTLATTTNSTTKTNSTITTNSSTPNTTHSQQINILQSAMSDSLEPQIPVIAKTIHSSSVQQHTRANVNCLAFQGQKGPALPLATSNVQTRLPISLLVAPAGTPSSTSALVSIDVLNTKNSSHLIDSAENDLSNAIVFNNCDHPCIFDHIYYRPELAAFSNSLLESIYTTDVAPLVTAFLQPQLTTVKSLGRTLQSTANMTPVPSSTLISVSNPLVWFDHVFYCVNSQPLSEPSPCIAPSKAAIQNNKYLKQGIVLHSIDEILQSIREADRKHDNSTSTLSLSYIGVVGDRVFDLLAPTGANISLPRRNIDSASSLEIPSIHQLTSLSEAVNILLRGLGSRQTLVDQAAHTPDAIPGIILTLSLTRRTWNVSTDSYNTFASKFNFVDLIIPKSSDSSSKTSPNVDSAQIQHHLASIEPILAALAAGRPVMDSDFESSKLAMHLKDSISSESSMCRLLARISPKQIDLSSSCDILSFSNRIRHIPPTVSTEIIDEQVLATLSCKDLQQTVIKLQNEIKTLTDTSRSNLAGPTLSDHKLIHNTAALLPPDLKHVNALVQSKLDSLRVDYKNLERHYNFISTELALAQLNSSASVNPSSDKRALLEHGQLVTGPFLDPHVDSTRARSNSVNSAESYTPSGMAGVSGGKHENNSMQTLYSSVGSSNSYLDEFNQSLLESTQVSSSDSTKIGSASLNDYKHSLSTGDVNLLTTDNRIRMLEARLFEVTRVARYYRNQLFHHTNVQDNIKDVNSIDLTKQLPVSVYIEQLELQNKTLKNIMQTQETRLCQVTQTADQKLIDAHRVHTTNAGSFENTCTTSNTLSLHEHTTNSTIPLLKVQNTRTAHIEKIEPNLADSKADCLTTDVSTKDAFTNTDVISVSPRSKSTQNDFASSPVLELTQQDLALAWLQGESGIANYKMHLLTTDFSKQLEKRDTDLSLTNAEHANVLTKLALSEDHIKKHVDTLTEKQQLIDQLKDDIKTLEGKHDPFVKKHFELETRFAEHISKRNNEVSQYEETVQILYGNVRDARVQIQSLAHQNSLLQQKLESSAKSLSSAISPTDSALNTPHESVATVDTRTLDFETEHKALQPQPPKSSQNAKTDEALILKIKYLQRLLQSNVSNLEATKADHAALVAELRAQLDNLTQSNNTLGTEYANSLQRYADFLEKHKHLESEYELLQKKHDHLTYVSSESSAQSQAEIVQLKLKLDRMAVVSPTLTSERAIAPVYFNLPPAGRSISPTSRPISPDPTSAASFVSVSGRASNRELMRLLNQLSIKCQQIDSQGIARLAWLAGELGIVSWKLHEEQEISAELRRIVDSASQREQRFVTIIEQLQDQLTAPADKELDQDESELTVNDLRSKLAYAEATQRALSRTVEYYKMAYQHRDSDSSLEELEKSRTVSVNNTPILLDTPSIQSKAQKSTPGSISDHSRDSLVKSHAPLKTNDGLVSSMKSLGEHENQSLDSVTQDQFDVHKMQKELVRLSQLEVLYNALQNRMALITRLESATQTPTVLTESQSTETLNDVQDSNMLAVESESRSLSKHSSELDSTPVADFCNIGAHESEYKLSTNLQLELHELQSKYADLHQNYMQKMSNIENSACKFTQTMGILQPVQVVKSLTMTDTSTSPIEFEPTNDREHSLEVDTPVQNLKLENANGLQNYSSSYIADIENEAVLLRDRIVILEQLLESKKSDSQASESAFSSDKLHEAAHLAFSTPKSVQNNDAQIESQPEFSAHAIGTKLWENEDKIEVGQDRGIADQSHNIEKEKTGNPSALSNMWTGWFTRNTTQDLNSSYTADHNTANSPTPQNYQVSRDDQPGTGFVANETQYYFPIQAENASLNGSPVLSEISENGDQSRDLAALSSTGVATSFQPSSHMDTICMADRLSAALSDKDALTARLAELQAQVDSQATLQAETQSAVHLAEQNLFSTRQENMRLVMKTQEMDTLISQLQHRSLERSSFDVNNVHPVAVAEKEVQTIFNADPNSANLSIANARIRHLEFSLQSYKDNLEQKTKELQSQPKVEDIPDNISVKSKSNGWGNWFGIKPSSLSVPEVVYGNISTEETERMLQDDDDSFETESKLDNASRLSISRSSNVNTIPTQARQKEYHDLENAQIYIKELESKLASFTHQASNVAKQCNGDHDDFNKRHMDQETQLSCLKKEAGDLQETVLKLSNEKTLTLMKMENERQELQSRIAYLEDLQQTFTLQKDKLETTIMGNIGKHDQEKAELEAERDALLKQLDELQEHHDTAKSRSVELETTIMGNIGKHDQEKAELEAERDALLKQLDELQEHHDTAKSRSVELETTIMGNVEKHDQEKAELEAERDALLKQLDELQEHHDTAKSRSVELETTIMGNVEKHDQEKAELEAERDALLKQLDELQEHHDTAKSRSVELETTIMGNVEKHDQEKAELEAERDALLKQLDELQEHHDTAKSRSVELETTIMGNIGKHDQEKAELEAERDALLKQLDELQEHHDTAKSRSVELETTIMGNAEKYGQERTEFEAERDALLKQLDELQEHHDTAKSRSVELETTIMGNVEKHDQEKAELEAERDALLKQLDELQEHHDTAKSRSVELETTIMGNIGKHDQERTEFEAERDALLKQLDELQEHHDTAKSRSVELETTIMGNVEKHDQEKAELEAERDALLKQLDELQEHHDTAKSRSVELETTIMGNVEKHDQEKAELEAERDALLKQLDELQEHHDTAKSRSVELETTIMGNIGKHDQEKAELEAERDALLKQLDELQEHHDTAKSRSVELETTIMGNVEKHDQEKAELEAERDALLKQLDELQEHHTIAKSRSVELETTIMDNIGKHDQEKAELEAERDALLKQLDELQEHHTIAKSRSVELETTIMDNIGKHDQEKAELEAERDALLKQLDELQEHYGTAKRNNAELISTVQDAHDYISKLQSDLSHVSDQLNALQARNFSLDSPQPNFYASESSIISQNNLIRGIEADKANLADHIAQAEIDRHRQYVLADSKSPLSTTTIVTTTTTTHALPPDADTQHSDDNDDDDIVLLKTRAGPTYQPPIVNFSSPNEYVGNAFNDNRNLRSFAPTSQLPATSQLDQPNTAQFEPSGLKHHEYHGIQPSTAHKTVCQPIPNNFTDSSYKQHIYASSDACLQTDMSSQDIEALGDEMCELLLAVKQYKATILEAEQLQNQIQDLEEWNQQLLDSLDAERGMRIESQGKLFSIQNDTALVQQETIATELLDIYRAHLVDVALDRDRYKQRLETMAAHTSLNPTIENNITLTETRRYVTAHDTQTPVTTLNLSSQDSLQREEALCSPVLSVIESSISDTTSVPSISFDSAVSLERNIVRRFSTVSLRLHEPETRGSHEPSMNRQLHSKTSSFRIGQRTIMSSRSYQDMYRPNNESVSSTARLRSLVDRQAIDISKLEFELNRAQSILNSQWDHIQVLSSQLQKSCSSLDRPSTSYDLSPSSSKNAPRIDVNIPSNIDLAPHFIEIISAPAAEKTLTTTTKSAAQPLHSRTTTFSASSLKTPATPESFHLSNANQTTGTYFNPQKPLSMSEYEHERHLNFTEMISQSQMMDFNHELLAARRQIAELQVKNTELSCVIERLESNRSGRKSNLFGWKPSK
ncbi:hypothetical protein BDEG_24556 [Batrachochytrium dendrobatidis JEL423]|uniref:Kinesin motor domain-containing protein n=2 Tax=Batrachochytrium dendrobatidis (strain JEL423) TaxID=403673 RepID=A0A177WMH8_BATDL|nr:hypothetical protein BDEG_24556 [Batrachochytrium dendrobatidis JEL423]